MERKVLMTESILGPHVEERGMGCGPREAGVEEELQWGPGQWFQDGEDTSAQLSSSFCLCSST